MHGEEGHQNGVTEAFVDPWTKNSIILVHNNQQETQEMLDVQ